MKYDVIVIGSGLGGLECGYILARQGKRVLILEQGAQPGGCMQSYRRRGFSLDTGFHYVGGLGEGQSLYPAFKYLGLMDLPWHQLDKDGFDKVSIGDKTFALAQGYDRFVEQLLQHFPAERLGLEHYARLLRQSAADQLSALSPRPPLAEGSMEMSMAYSAWQFLQVNFHDPMLRNVLSGTCLRMELRKETLPLFSFLHGNGSYVESSWRLKGNGAQVVDQLAAGICEQGGEIICRTKVDELVEKDGKLVGAVCENGEIYEADVFISDIHPSQTIDLVKESSKLKRVYHRRIHSVENTFGMFTVSLVLPPNTLRYFNYNQYIYDVADVWEAHEPESGKVKGVLVSCRVPEDGSEYTQQMDLLTPMPWAHCQVWQDTKVGHRGDEYEADKKCWADKCIALAEPFFPEIKHYLHRYTSTPLTWHDYTLAPQGTAYGMRKDYRNPLMTILSPRTPIPNLLLTGQNLMLHGVHGVTMTSLYTCAEVLGKEAVWKIVEGE